MSEAYKIRDPELLHFTTSTVVNWIDLFTRRSYCDIIMESLEYCQNNRGLEIYAYCLMSNHLHMIVRAKNGDLPAILRDFKKYTSKSIIKFIKETHPKRKWMLEHFEKAGKKLKRIKGYKFWQDGNHPIELATNYLLDQKLEYIHQNPVKAGIVNQPEDYVYSSARNYNGEQGVLNVISIEDGVEI